MNINQVNLETSLLNDITIIVVGRNLIMVVVRWNCGAQNGSVVSPVIFRCQQRAYTNRNLSSVWWCGVQKLGGGERNHLSVVGA